MVALRDRSLQPRAARRGPALCGAVLYAILAAHSPLICAGETDGKGNGFFGLLRARDLTPFGLLRLDMRPAHSVPAAPGTWTVEMEGAYQNTWAMSAGVESYLSDLRGRPELGPAELQAIRALPGENYLVDMELAQLDVTFNYRLSKHWSTYTTLSALSYQGGFLDSAIESFHDAFGFSNFNRPAARRNDVNLIFDLKSAQLAYLESPTRGGVRDPVAGVMYTHDFRPGHWNLVLNAAVKIPLQGRRLLLSTGRADFGLQATLQHFSQQGALYLSAAGVYYDGTPDLIPTPAQVTPTFIVGYERRLGPRTHAIVQGYVSPSVYDHRVTDLDELLKTKYQLSAGIYRRLGRAVVWFAFTENLQNFNNTPDVGFQLGWAFEPMSDGAAGAARP